MCNRKTLLNHNTEKVFLEYLSVELTRRCNATCEHCVRGESQNLSINRSYIDDLLEKVGGIRYLAVTGGEPSLAAQEIIYLLESLKKGLIDFHHGYLVTNGLDVSQDFLCSLQKFNDSALCDTVMYLSNDNYHPEPSLENLERLFSLPFIHRGFLNEWTPDEVIAEGRAKTWGQIRVIPKPIEVESFYVSSHIYLNAVGQVLTDSCLSYESQEKPDFFISRAAEFGTSAMEAYNRRHFQGGSHV
jgi:hypothetical protein